MMQAENVRISEILPYENNPRIIDKAADAVAGSIQRFGFLIPIILDENNVIVCGHARFAAAKKLGMDEVPCVRAENLTDQQIKAFRLVDNKVAELSGWDEERLLDELSDLDEDLLGGLFEKFDKGGSLERKVLQASKELTIEDDFEYCCPFCGFKFNQL